MPTFLAPSSHSSGTSRRPPESLLFYLADPGPLARLVHVDVQHCGWHKFLDVPDLYHMELT